MRQFSRILLVLTLVLVATMANGAKYAGKKGGASYVSSPHDIVGSGFEEDPGYDGPPVDPRHEDDGECTLTLAVRDDGNYPNVKVSLRVPSSAYWQGCFRIEAYTKGPWGINRGGEWWSPISYNGKGGLMDESGYLPWWEGESPDHGFHYAVQFPFTLRFEKYPWSGGTIYANAYHMRSDGQWVKVAEKQQTFSPGHKHRIRVRPLTDTGWYDDPLSSSTKIIIGTLAITSTGAKVALDLRGTAVCAKAIPELIGMVLKKYPREIITAGLVKYLRLEILVTHQFRLHERAYWMNCYHYDQPDMSFSDPTEPDTRKYYERLIEGRDRFNFIFDGNEPSPDDVKDYGYVNEDTVIGGHYATKDWLYCSSRGEKQVDHLPTSNWGKTDETRALVARQNDGHRSPCGPYYPTEGQ